MGNDATMDRLRSAHAALAKSREILSRPSPQPTTTRKRSLPPLRPNTLGARIVQAAHTLAQPFTLEALVLACWQQHGAPFGLRGFAGAYPDSHAVRCALFGRRGLIARGHLSYDVHDETKLRVYE